MPDMPRTVPIGGDWDTHFRIQRGLPTGSFWFAEYDDEEEDLGDCRWRPCLQYYQSMVLSSDGGPWFRTRAECEEFIQDAIVGARASFEEIHAVGRRYRASDPEPGHGVTVQDSHGRLWRRTDDNRNGGGGANWEQEGVDYFEPESWTHVAGNCGPVRVVEVADD